MIDRRFLLGSAAAAAAAALSPSLAAAQPPAAKVSDPAEAARLKALMDAFMAEDLRLDPETATSLGLDTGELAWTKSEFGDASLAGHARAKALTASQLERLRKIRRDALGGMDGVDYDAVEAPLAVTEEANRRFAYGGSGAESPYVLSQITGAEPRYWRAFLSRPGPSRPGMITSEISRSMVPACSSASASASSPSQASITS